MRIHRMIDDGEYPNCTKMAGDERTDAEARYRIHEGQPEDAD